MLYPRATDPARVLEEVVEEERSILVEQFRAAKRAVFGGGYGGDFSIYENRPVEFTRQVLGQKTWPGSQAVMQDLVTHRRVGVQACRKSTKTHTAAQLVLAMTIPSRTTTVTTASVWAQVKELIWARIGEMHAKARRKLPGDCFTTTLRIGPGHGAIGLSTDKPGRIQGFHAGLDMADSDPADPMAFDSNEILGMVERPEKGSRLFLVVDEAAEVRAPILEALYGSMIGDHVYALWQFNPTFDPDSAHPAARIMRSGSGWRRIHFAGEDFDPSLEPDPADRCFHALPWNVQPENWRREREHDWGGKDSPLYRVHVLGLPAGLELSRQFVPHSLLVLQAARAPSWVDREELERRHISWDVSASEDGDANVAQLWIGGRLVATVEWRTHDLVVSCEKVIALAYEWGTGGAPIHGSNIHVDTTGVGKGCIGIFRSKGFEIDAVDFGAKPRGNWPSWCREMHFKNLKAELCWVLRRAMELGGALVPPEFHNVWIQAKWHTWKEVPHAEGTAIAVAETKEDLKARFGRSPDDFDAAILAWSRFDGGVGVGSVPRV